MHSWQTMGLMYYTRVCHIPHDNKILREALQGLALRAFSHHGPLVRHPILEETGAGLLNGCQYFPSVTYIGVFDGVGVIRHELAQVTVADRSRGSLACEPQA